MSENNPRYEIIVGNIGSVLQTNQLRDALMTYSNYKQQSISKYGRAGNEQVTLLDQGEPLYEHFPDTNDEGDGVDE